MNKQFLTALLLATLALTVRAAEGVLLDRVVAVVNDDVILASELEDEVASIRARLAERGVQLPPDEVFRQQVLQQMVMQELQLQMAERGGIRISDDQLNQTLANIAQRYGVSLSGLPERLAREGVDYAEFRERIRREMTINTVQRLDVLERISVTDREIDQYLADQDASSGVEYRISHILVSVPSEPSPQEVAERRARAEKVLEELAGGTDFAQAAVAYSDAQDALSGGEIGWRSAEQLPRPFAEALAGLAPGQTSGLIRTPGGFHILKLHETRRQGEEPVLVTQTRARHILLRPNAVLTDTQAREKLHALRERILAGESFAELARKHSDDPGSAAQGGDLGWAVPGTYTPEFEEALERLEPGEISEPFRSRFGWHIVQLEDRRRQDMTREIRRSRARQAIRQRKFEEQLPIWLQRQWDEAYLEFHIPGMEQLNS